MKISICLFVVLLIAGFNLKQNEPIVIKGDLMFQTVSFMSLYGAPDSIYQSLLKEIDRTLLSEENRKSQEYKLSQHFDQLRENNLLRNPYLFLRIEVDSTMVIYLSDKEYDKVKDYKHFDLLDEYKKVVLSLEVEKLGENIYYSDKIVDVEKVSGQTFPNLKPIKNF